MILAKIFLTLVSVVSVVLIGSAPRVIAVTVPVSGVASVGPGSWIGARWGNNYAASWNAVNANWAAQNWANHNTNPNWACSLPGAQCHNNPNWAAQNAGHASQASQAPVTWASANANPTWACSLPGAQCHNNPHWATHRYQYSG